MCKICPKCGAIAEYNAYYERITCTRCSWESDKKKAITSTFVVKSHSLEKLKRAVGGA